MAFKLLSFGQHLMEFLLQRYASYCERVFRSHIVHLLNVHRTALDVLRRTNVSESTCKMVQCSASEFTLYIFCKVVM